MQTARSDCTLAFRELASQKVIMGRSRTLDKRRRVLFVEELQPKDVAAVPCFSPSVNVNENCTFRTIWLFGPCCCLYCLVMSFELNKILKSKAHFWNDVKNNFLL